MTGIGFEHPKLPAGFIGTVCRDCAGIFQEEVVQGLDLCCQRNGVSKIQHQNQAACFVEPVAAGITRGPAWSGWLILASVQEGALGELQGVQGSVVVYFSPSPSVGMEQRT